MIEAGIYALIASAPSIAALIPDVSKDANPGDIAFGPAPVDRGQTQFPCMTYQINREKADYALDGPEYESGLLQINIYTKDSPDAIMAIIRAVRRAIDKYSGVLNEGTRVLSIFHLNSFPSFENDGDSFRGVTEYEIQFVEPN